MKTVIKMVRDKWHLTRVCFYCIRASWRICNGRWYVWRDAPKDIVRTVASLWYLVRKKPAKEVTSLIHEAHKEYRIRKQKGKA